VTTTVNDVPCHSKPLEPVIPIRYEPGGVESDTVTVSVDMAEPPDERLTVAGLSEAERVGG